MAVAPTAEPTCRDMLETAMGVPARAGIGAVEFFDFRPYAFHSDIEIAVG